MGALGDTRVFNRPDRVVEGWYWALRSKELRRGRAVPLRFLGKDLVVYRGADGRVVALDAHCPHMGAHLAEGKVEGNSIRCLFHYWKFDSAGDCEEIPCQASVAGVPTLRAWAVEEKYGLVWIWAGRGARPARPVPYVPEYEGLTTEARLGRPFVKNCHPNVMMINAIDAQHFNSVHRMPLPLRLEPEARNASWILFRNQTRATRETRFQRLLGRLYRERLTYDLSYWFGSTGSVTVGPDFLHFHIIFALRPTADGRSEGQTILVTRARAGLAGRALNAVLLKATELVGNYFAKGDTLIFKSIRFAMRFPVRADAAIIRFIQHVEEQPTLAWGLEPEPGPEGEYRPAPARSHAAEAL